MLLIFTYISMILSYVIFLFYSIPNMILILAKYIFLQALT